MLLCSRNARPRKALVACAQWEHNSRPYFLPSAREEKGRRTHRDDDMLSQFSNA